MPLRARLDEISEDTRFLLEGRVQHNPQYAEAIVSRVDKNTATLQNAIRVQREGRRAENQEVTGIGRNEDSRSSSSEIILHVWSSMLLLLCLFLRAVQHFTYGLGEFPLDQGLHQHLLDAHLSCVARRLPSR